MLVLKFADVAVWLVVMVSGTFFFVIFLSFLLRNFQNFVYPSVFWLSHSQQNKFFETDKAPKRRPPFQKENFSLTEVCS